MARFYWGFREWIHPWGWRRWAAIAKRLLLILYILSWFNVKNRYHSNYLTTFWFFLGPSQALLLNQSLFRTYLGSSIQLDYLFSSSQVRLCPSMSSPWLLLCMSKSSVTLSGFYWAWAQQRNVPFFSPWEFGTKLAASLGFSSPLCRVSSLVGSLWSVWMSLFML